MENLIAYVDNEDSLLSLLKDNPDTKEYILQNCDRKLLLSKKVFYYLLDLHSDSNILENLPWIVSNDRNKVIHAVANNNNNIPYIHKKLKHNKKFMMFIIKQFGLSYLSEKEIAMLPKYFFKEKFFFLRKKKKNTNVFNRIDKTINTISFINEILNVNQNVYNYLSPKLKEYFIYFKSQEITQYSDSDSDIDIDIDSDSYTENNEFVFLTDYTSNKNRSDYCYVRKAINYIPTCFKYSNLLDHVSTCRYAISRHKDNISYCSPRVQKILENDFASNFFNKKVSQAHIRLVCGRLNLACDLLIQIFENLPKIKIKILYNTYNELLTKKTINEYNSEIFNYLLDKDILKMLKAQSIYTSRHFQDICIFKKLKAQSIYTNVLKNDI